MKELVKIAFIAVCVMSLRAAGDSVVTIPTSLPLVEPYAIGDSFWEEWIFECDCGTVAKRPRRVSPIR